MAASEYTRWLLRGKLNKGVSWKPTAKEAFNAAIKITEEKFTSTKKQITPCSKCGIYPVLMCPNRKCDASPFNG